MAPTPPGLLDALRNALRRQMNERRLQKRRAHLGHDPRHPDDQPSLRHALDLLK
jgi:hypothetical protein